VQALSTHYLVPLVIYYQHGNVVFVCGREVSLLPPVACPMLQKLWWVCQRFIALIRAAVMPNIIVRRVGVSMFVTEFGGARFNEVVGVRAEKLGDTGSLAIWRR
jgi:hypothetical protein